MPLVWCRGTDEPREWQWLSASKGIEKKTSTEGAPHPKERTHHTLKLNATWMLHHLQPQQGALKPCFSIDRVRRDTSSIPRPTTPTCAEHTGCLFCCAGILSHFYHTYDFFWVIGVAPARSIKLNCTELLEVSVWCLLYCTLVAPLMFSLDPDTDADTDADLGSIHIHTHSLTVCTVHGQIPDSFGS